MRIENKALVLRRVPFRDTSWIVTLLTPGFGVVSAVARAARLGGRDGARGALTGFHLLEVELRARTEEALGTLSRVEILEARNRLPFMATATAAGQVLIEAVHRFEMPGDARGGEVFACLDSSLEALEAEVEPLVVVAGALGRLLGLFGHGWRVRDCVGCGRRERLRFFSVRRGGAVCEPCGLPYAHRLPEASASLLRALSDRSWPPAMIGLSREEMALLYRLGMAGLARIGTQELSADGTFRRLAGLDGFQEIKGYAS
ncbi:MAG: DNA repair protein RecO [Magnetococcales bacterium]|nr:DNA repair protein RecO [Magnetococcales bacterium]